MDAQQVDAQHKLAEITALVEGARAMPMSASCVVNRTQLLDLLEELAALLPAELERARWVLGDRDEVVAEGRREAERIVEAAYAERRKLVAETDLVREAAAEAERVVAEARSQAQAMRSEVEDYVDAKLANFEVVLQKTLAAVERGRSKLGGRSELDALTPSEATAELRKE